jgi:hypothetical protein
MYLTETTYPDIQRARDSRHGLANALCLFVEPAR